MLRVLILGAAVAAVLSGCAPRAFHAPGDYRFEPTADDRAAMEEMVAAMLEREALYTLAGGIKPASTGFWRAGIDLEDPDTAPLSRARRALRLFEQEFPAYEAAVAPFAAEYDGRRPVDAFVAHRGALRAMIERHQDFWAPYGICPESSAEEAFALVERMPALDRFRGYGYLFGYPDYAVDFFVEAAASEQETGEFVRRTFVAIPTIIAERGRFTWAAPEDHAGHPDDDRLRAACAPVLDAYQAILAEHGEDSPATQRLRALRRWLARTGPPDASPVEALRPAA